MKKYIIIIFVILFIIFNIQEISCVERLSLIQKKAILIEIITRDYPDIKNQAYDYIILLNPLISEDLAHLENAAKIKKYAVFIRYLCHITISDYDVIKGYTCELSYLNNCHHRHIDQWCHVFL